MHDIESIIFLDKDSPLRKEYATNEGNAQVQLRNDLERYIYDSARALGKLSNGIEKARLSLSLLNLEHLNAIDSNDGEKAKYIEMIVENSIIRVQSVYDRVLIFVNAILDLGIHDECINHKLFVTNEWSKRYSLEKKIKAVNSACNDYRYIRNTVIHHDRYSEEDLDRITLFLQINHIQKQQNDKEFIDNELLKNITNDYLNTKQYELSEYLDKIENNIFKLYDELLKIYNHKKQMIKLM